MASTSGISVRVGLIASASPPIEQSFDYNDRNELTASTRSPTIWGYEYDNIGNRDTYDVTGQPQTTYTANPLNQYTQANTPTTPTPMQQTYEYDEDGNLIELYVAADRALPVGRGDQAIGRASHYPS